MVGGRVALREKEEITDKLHVKLSIEEDAETNLVMLTSAEVANW